MARPNTWNRLTPDQQQQFGIAQLTEQADRHVTLKAAWKELAIHETSELAWDNAATMPYRMMSTEIQYLLASGFDHLDLVFHRIDEKQLPPFALYTLIRSAVDSIGVALWLCVGGTANKRVLRLLQLQWAQRELVDRYTKSVETHIPENTAWLAEVLTYIKDQRGALKQRSFRAGMPTTTDLLKSVEMDLRWRPVGLSPLNVWRACSGVTHGNQNFAEGLAKLAQPVTLPTGEQKQSRMTTPGAVSMMLGPTQDFLERLLGMLVEMSSPTNRSVPTLLTGGPPIPHAIRTNPTR